jgi:hypothetical protein
VLRYDHLLEILSFFFAFLVLFCGYYCLRLPFAVLREIFLLPLCLTRLKLQGGRTTVVDVLNHASWVMASMANGMRAAINWK